MEYEVINTAGRFGAFVIPKEWPRCERILMCNPVPKPLIDFWAVINRYGTVQSHYRSEENAKTALRSFSEGTSAPYSIVHMREVREESK